MEAVPAEELLETRKLEEIPESELYDFIWEKPTDVEHITLERDLSLRIWRGDKWGVTFNQFDGDPETVAANVLFVRSRYPNLNRTNGWELNVVVDGDVLRPRRRFWIMLVWKSTTPGPITALTIDKVILGLIAEWFEELDRRIVVGAWESEGGS